MRRRARPRHAAHWLRRGAPVISRSRGPPAPTSCSRCCQNRTARLNIDDRPIDRHVGWVDRIAPAAHGMVVFESACRVPSHRDLQGGASHSQIDRREVVSHLPRLKAHRLGTCVNSQPRLDTRAPTAHVCSAPSAIAIARILFDLPASEAPPSLFASPLRPASLASSEESGCRPQARALRLTASARGARWSRACGRGRR